MRREHDRRLIPPTAVRYDQSGNVFVRESIGDTEICNVPDSMRFIKPEDLDEATRQLLLGLLRNSQPHSITADDHLTSGARFAATESRGSTRSHVPAVLRVGTITGEAGALAVTGNVLISFHEFGEAFEPAIIGFEISDNSKTTAIRQTAENVLGTSLSEAQYHDIIAALQAIPKDVTIPHPGTKEFVRQEATFKELALAFQAAGLAELPGAMFKWKGTAAEVREQTVQPPIVAVHPYYLAYHDALGQRNTQTAEERQQLQAKYDQLFQEHTGPLIVVEEEARVITTLQHLQALGRGGDIYFVITENTDSSLFPYTNDAEYIALMEQLGSEGLRFVGGHDAANRPYVAHNPLSHSTTTYSGCLRGLANRIEARGFPKVETIPGYTYA